jgi:hypothetical protein
MEPNVRPELVVTLSVNGGAGGDDNDDDDMPIKSITGQFNIFFYNVEYILYDHSRSICKDTLLRKIFSLRYR